MVKVSEQFKEAIYAPIRQTTGRVTFDISDTTIEKDTITITTTPEFIISDKQQLTDKVRENTYKLATWEPDRFKLDGSFSFPDENVANNKKIGWVSSSLCDENGEFSPYEILSFQFGFEHSSMGITITFGEGYATDFTVVGYRADSVIESVDVVDNKDTQVVVLGQFYLYDKIEVIIKKWNVPYRRARVAEVDFGVVRVYAGDDLISMSLIEEMDLVATTIPSSELKFTVYNKNREFNILNPKGFYKFLQERQQITPEIGIVTENGETEYVKLGKFYLMDWISDEGALTTTFTARNIIDLVATFEYENLEARDNYTLYDMAEDILNLCGVEQYEIDEGLKSIYTKGLVKKTDCRNILQYIAIAGMANVYVTKDNVIHIKQTPTELGQHVDVMDLDNMYDEPKIELESPIKSVQIAYYEDLENRREVVINNNVDKGATLKVDNPLINTEEHAIEVGNWVLQQKKYRAKYSVSWRGNPAHELGDVVIIEDAYEHNNKSILTKIELSYQGYLNGKVEARGLIE